MKRRAIHSDARGTDMRKWIAVLGAIALASGLSVVVGAQDASDDEAAVKNIAGQWAKGWNAGDMTAIGDLYTDDSDYVDLFGASHKGRADIEATFGEINSAVYKGSKISIEMKAVHFVKPDLAVADSVWEVSDLPKAEGPAPPSKGQATLVAAKQADGQWKIVAHRTRVPQSPVPAPEE